MRAEHIVDLFIFWARDGASFVVSCPSFSLDSAAQWKFQSCLTTFYCFWLYSGSLGTDDGASRNDASQGGRYSRDFFNRYGDLRHIRRLRFWPLNKVLMEKYEFSEQDANNMTDFLVPILDFVPEKRPTAAQCLLHPWINAGPRGLEPSMPSTQTQGSDQLNSEKKERDKDEREEMEAGMSNIAISVDFKSGRDTQSSSKATKLDVEGIPFYSNPCESSSTAIA
ncbi:hypothetical protein Patl1_32325 [Pistacia atlantica]|uniref:Uncharacterized protein n=1 Tax=Pistacia atlantica TaxID=434234 RepID=A0ACC1APF3_9ROSI|nr:hypothetical protein Patl1_32325 [Pistacia atlantica]